MNSPRAYSKSPSRHPLFRSKNISIQKIPSAIKDRARGEILNHPRCHPYSKLSFLLRTSYACDITVAPVGSYTAKAFGPPSKVHSRSIPAPRSHHPQLSVAVTLRYYSFSKVIIVTLYSAKAYLSSGKFIFCKFVYKLRECVISSNIFCQESDT